MQFFQDFWTKNKIAPKTALKQKKEASYLDQLMPSKGHGLQELALVEVWDKGLDSTGCKRQ